MEITVTGYIQIGSIQITIYAIRGIKYFLIGSKKTIPNIGYFK